MEIEIELYKTPSGRCPFDDWFESLQEKLTWAKILTRLDRLKLGNFGDCKTKEYLREHQSREKKYDKK